MLLGCCHPPNTALDLVLALCGVFGGRREKSAVVFLNLQYPVVLIFPTYFDILRTRFLVFTTVYFFSDLRPKYRLVL